jgi:hypothetical protein
MVSLLEDAKPAKPRLWMDRGWWVCGRLMESYLTWASGETPRKAYENWSRR